MKSPLIVTSIGFHLAVVAGFFVAGLWKLEKLDAERRPIDIAVAPQPTPAASGSPAAAPTTFTRKKPKVVTKELVQPEKDVTARPSATTALDTGGTGGTGSGAGSGSGTVPTGTGECVGDHCGEPTTEKTEPKIPPKKQDPVFVPPSVFKAIRTSGQTQIQPPPNVRTSIQRDGKSKVMATFKICIDAQGEVASITKLQSSGYDGYDHALEAGIGDWRYRPYEVGGRKVAVCSAVTFIYTLH